MSQSTSQKDGATPPQAILLIVGAGLLFTLLDTGAKYLVLSGMSAQFVAWMRFAEHLVLALVLLRGWSNRRIFLAASLPKQVVRGVLLFGTTCFNFLALGTLQLAETMSIFFFAPMIVTALAGPVLGEWAGWRRWLAIGAGFIGVLVITRPGFAAFGLGHIYALASTLSYCFYVLMTRQMSSTESPESLIFYSALAPVVLMSPVVPYTASMPSDAWHLAILLSLGFFGGFGHWLLIKAYRIASTTALAPYPYLQMVWMIVSGLVVFNQFPDVWTLVGAGIIVAGGLYILHREHRLRLAERSAPTAEDASLAKKL
jgi:drug/metabolite transporter (DMT)-like permease